MPEKKRRPVLITVVTLLALVVVAGAVAGGYLLSLASSFENKSQSIPSAFPAESARPDPSAESEDAVNILLLGSDSQGGSGETENLEGVPNAGRSDTMMLVHIPGDRSGVYVTSIVRDTWVEIPGEGEHKINAAFSLGGVPLAVQTLESLFGARIDHVASIDMEGFKGLTNALGGVDVNVPVSFSREGYTFEEGVQHMDGDEALAFVRERKSFADGDFQRVRNQQAFIKAVLGEVLSRETMTDPGKIAAVVNELSPYVSRSESLGATEIARLGVSLAGIRSDDVHFFTLPTAGFGRSADGQSIILPDEEAIAAFGEALQSDTVAEFVSERDL